MNISATNCSISLIFGTADVKGPKEKTSSFTYELSFTFLSIYRAQQWMAIKCIPEVWS